jgi:hypothetical protein
MSLHFTWTSEKTNGVYSKCGADVVLVTAVDCWDIHDSLDDSFQDSFETGVEVSGHYCRHCATLTSISVNS